MTVLQTTDEFDQPISFLYDLVFVINVNSKGWILEKICKVIAENSGLKTRIITTEYNNKITGWLPPARAYFFAHFKLFLGSIGSPAYPPHCKKFVWFTHPDFPADNGRDRLVTALNQATQVFTANKFHRQALEFMGVEPDKLTTIIGGADPQQFERRKRAGKTVGFVGAYYERKNPDTMLALIKAMPDVQFCLLAPHHSEVENRSLLWENWPRFSEFFDCPNFEFISARFEDFPKHFARFDVYVSLSRLEGGPIPLLEAMFANIYPVATRTGFGEDLIDSGQNGILLPVSPALEAVVDAVRTALADQSTDIAATVADYSWEAFGKKFRDVIDPALRPDRPAPLADDLARLTYLRDGWSNFDGTGVWLEMRGGSLRMRVSGEVRALAFAFEAAPSLATPGVTVSFSVNGVLAGTGQFAPGSHEFEIDLPSGDAGEALIVDVQLVADELDHLGTIRLDHIAALAREAVPPVMFAGIIPARDNAGDGLDAARARGFALPVTILSRPEPSLSGAIIRSLSGPDVRIVSAQDLHAAPEREGVWLSHGLQSAPPGAEPGFHGYIFDDAAELPGEPALAEDSVLVLPEIVRATVPSRPWPKSAKPARAVFLRDAAERDAERVSWIVKLLEEQGISSVSAPRTLPLAKERATGSPGPESAALLEADLCFIAGRDSDLPIIAECLGMGIPVLLFGPSALYPALDALDLKYLFIHNRSRLLKTIRMLSKGSTRREAIERLRDCLENHRGLAGTKHRVTQFISGVVARQVLKDMDARIGLVIDGQDAAGTARVGDLIAAAGAQPVLLDLSQIHGTCAGLRSGSARQHGAEDGRIDAILCLSREARDICRSVFAETVPVMQVETGDWAILGHSASLTEAADSTIMLPWAFASREPCRATLPGSPNHADARRTLGIPDDAFAVLCVGPDPQSSHEVAALAQVARIAGDVPVRFIFLSADPAPDEQSDCPIRASCGDNAIFCRRETDAADTAFQAADAALILSPPADANFIGRAFSHGLPTLVRSDAPEAAYVMRGLNGAAIDIADPESISKAVKGLLEGAEARRILSEQALATADSLPSLSELNRNFAAQLLAGLQSKQGC